MHKLRCVGHYGKMIPVEISRENLIPILTMMHGFGAEYLNQGLDKK